MMHVAFPLMVSTSTEAMLMFIDRLYLKHVSEESMNACLSGGFTSFTFVSFFIGIIGFSTALVAQNFGAGRFADCSRVLTQTVLFSALSVPVVLMLIPAGRWVLATAGPSASELVQAQTYLGILMAGTAFDFLRHSLNSFFGGLGKTRVVLLSTFVMAVTNLGANYVLIFGKLGFPALGIAGAGYGTVFAWFMGSAALMIAYFQHSRLPEYEVRKSFRVDVPIFKDLTRLGFASGLEILLPIFAIDLLILAFQSYGGGVSTAITVAFTWIHTLFIPVIGLEIGTMSLAGRFVGAREPEAVAESVFSGVFLSSIYAVLISLVCLVGTSAMIGVFLTPEASAETRELALWGTQLNAVMMFTFAWSAVLAGGLRGVGDTYGVMTTSAVFWWSQYLLVHVLINQFQLAPAAVLGAHAFSSPLLCVMMLARFRGGPWRKLRLAAA